MIKIESPLSIYDVVRKSKPTLVIKDRFVTQVVTKAKKVIKKDHIIGFDGIECRADSVI